jgi:hypothetical protein
MKIPVRYANDSTSALDGTGLGDISGYASRSEAELGLANKLAFWTGGDRVQTARLMRRSALYRDKMDREDYMRRTLDKAFEGRGPDDFYFHHLEGGMKVKMKKRA